MRAQGDGGFRHEVRAGKRLLAHSGMDSFIEDFYAPSRSLPMLTTLRRSAMWEAS